MQAVIDGYAAAATPDLIARFDSLSPEAIYAPVADLLPVKPAMVADIGCATGRDAAWFVAKGHQVLAVEPVDALREAGRLLHPRSGIDWLDDRLPDLALTRRRGPFDLITLCAVWQHLDSGAQRSAMPILASIVAPGGLLIMSLRHGPGANDRPVFPVIPEAVIADGCREGLTVARSIEAESVQTANRANGVKWTWLAFRRQPRP